MNYLILTVSVIFNLLTSGILRNQFCKKHRKSDADLHALNAVSSVVAAVVLAVIFLVRDGLAAPSLYTALFGIVFGIVTALCAITNMQALSCGPLSYTSVICTCSVVIPSFSGLLFFNESVSPLQYVGAAVMLISFFFAVDTENDERRTSARWFVFCLLCFIFNGSIGVMQKVHQSSPHKDELGAFLVIAFTVSALYSLFSMVYCRKKNDLPAEKGSLSSLLLYSLVCGGGIAFCNAANMYLSGVMDSIVLFPVLNGGSMILTTACGLLLWKEKLQKRQVIGLVLGIAAILLLCNTVPLLLRLFG